MRIALLEVKRAPGNLPKQSLRGMVRVLGSSSPDKVAEAILGELMKDYRESSLDSSALSSSSSRTNVMPSDVVARLEAVLPIFVAMSTSSVQLAFTEIPPPSLAISGDKKTRKIRSWKRPLKPAKIPGYVVVQEVLDCLQRRLRYMWEMSLDSTSSCSAIIYNARIQVQGRSKCQCLLWNYNNPVGECSATLGSLPVSAPVPHKSLSW